jgi:hypothetical protein
VLLCVLFDIDDEFVEEHHQRASKRAHRKDFVQRMHARNGKAYFLYIYIVFNLLINECMLRYTTSLISLLLNSSLIITFVSVCLYYFYIPIAFFTN